MNGIAFIKKEMLLILCFISGLLPAAGQSAFDPEYRQVASEITEDLVVFTDRTLYVSGEQIQFRIDYFRVGLPDNVPWSSVLYVELIGPGGRSVASGKYRSEHDYYSGSLDIPATALTGNYMLKCYTRWMRNAGPHRFGFLPLKIINPYTGEVVQPSDTTGGEHAKTRLIYVDNGLDCMIDDTVYQKGGLVTLTLTNTEATDPEGLRCCVTVVPLGSVDDRSGQVQPADGQHIRDPFQVSFLPDLEGRLSISGRALSADQIPVQECILYLSSLGRKPDLFTAITDQSGRFSFLVPPGNSDRELFIAPVPGGVEPVQIQIDLDFDNSGLPLQPEWFILSGKERKVATGLAIRKQLAESFASALPGTQHPDGAEPEQPLPFYGSVAEQINLDEYVNLPTMEEVFINLVPGVNVEHRKGKASFRIESDNNSIGYSDPLLLVDHIPVFDAGALLMLDPRLLDRIEVIREVYIKGPVAFGGVLSFISKNGNMAGIDLPEGSYFFDFKSLHPSEKEGEATLVPQERIPDIRNTVLWVDNIELLPGSAREISFKAPSDSGRYLVLVRGAATSATVRSCVAGFRIQ